MNFKLFFYLGFMSEYLVIGIAISLIFSIYVFFKTKRIFLFLKKNPKSKIAIIIRIILAVLIIPFCINVWAPSMILAFYIIMVSGIVDIINLIIYLVSKKKVSLFNKLFITTAMNLVIFIFFLVQGIYGMNHIVKTEYSVENNKNADTLKICFISDLHFGTIQEKERLTEKIDEINSENFDVVILGGDITDERTTKEDMEYCYEVLGGIQTTDGENHGIYFIYGNHDRQPYETDYVNGVRTYTDQELIDTIRENEITILCDDVVTIGNIVFVGRDDIGWDNDNNRASIEELLAGVDKEDKYIVVLDHQAIHQDEAISNSCSLELSGHTHAGQVFPFNLITTLLNTYCYGEYQIDSLTQIVSSGYTGWGWPVRNVGYCEYEVVYIK